MAFHDPLLSILEDWNPSPYLIRLQLNSSWNYTEDLPRTKFSFLLLPSQATRVHLHNTKKYQVTFNASRERNPKWERNRRAVWNSCAGGGGLHSVMGSGKLFFRHSSSLFWSMEFSKIICWDMPFLSFSCRSSSWKTLREMLIPPRSPRSTKKTAPSFRKALSHRYSSSCNSTARTFTKALSVRPCSVTQRTSKQPVCMGELLQIYVSSISYSFSLLSEQKLKHIWHCETLKYFWDTLPPPPPGGLKKPLAFAQKQQNSSHCFLAIAGY